jgi:hypothetical protein
MLDSKLQSVLAWAEFQLRTDEIFEGLTSEQVEILHRGFQSGFRYGQIYAAEYIKEVL